MMRSLRNRLIGATFAATLLILLGAAALLYGMIRTALVDEFDQTLLAKAKGIAAAAEDDKGRFELDLETAQMPEFEPGDRCEYFEIRGRDGAALARSASLASDSLPADAPGDTAVFRPFRLPDGRPGRRATLAAPIRTDLGEDDDAAASSRTVVTITVARDTLDLDRSLSRLAWLLASVTLGAAIFSAVVLIVVVRVTLGPIDALAARIADIDASNVSDLEKLSSPIEELDPVVDRLNELLARLDAALAREKAFTADVAHELRTPLAGLSAAMEVCCSRPRDEAAYQEVIAKCLGATRAMQSMVENLLLLARADVGRLPLQEESVDLLDLAHECWSFLESTAAERALQVHWPRDTRIAVVSDAGLLRLVIGNLLDNAVRHGDHGGTIDISIAADSEHAIVEVKNTGCDLSPDDADKVFERFWKHDAARTEGAEHCGLGLPLCRRIAETLGGAITATIADAAFTIRLTLRLS